MQFLVDNAGQVVQHLMDFALACGLDDGLCAHGILPPLFPPGLSVYFGEKALDPKRFCRSIIHAK